MKKLSTKKLFTKNPLIEAAMVECDAAAVVVEGPGYDDGPPLPPTLTVLEGWLRVQYTRRTGCF